MNNQNPLQFIEEINKKFFNKLQENREFTFKPGAISTKAKLLIAIALDASKGASDGVKSLAFQALENGATKEEIMEAVQVANFICGVYSTYTAAAGLKDVFK